MARSDKSKNNPLKDKTTRARKPEEGVSTTAEPPGQAAGEDRARFPQPASGSTKREELRRIQEEPSADLQEREEFFEPAPSASNGHPSVEDDSATHRRIAERAYLLFLEEGCRHGNDWAHWFEAERQIKETRV